MANQEEHVWSGSQSQLSNFGTYTLMLLVSLTIVVIPLTLIFFVCTYLVTKYNKYELTTHRLLTHKGVFSKTTDELELYRVLDTRCEQPFILRLFGFGNVILITSDKTSPTLTIKAVKDATGLRETIRHLVEERRNSKRVREVEIN